MKLKYVQTIIEAQNHEAKVLGLAWAPNNLKFAVATADRHILLFDEYGEKRDKFSTKPADSEAGKRSYIIKGISFSPDSQKLAVAQTDMIVYVYKIGDKWGEKKVICNKFYQPSPVTTMVWLLSGPIVCGLIDGKVRILQLKSNKSNTLYSTQNIIVALTTNVNGTAFLSGDIEGNIIRYGFETKTSEKETNGKIVTHSVPPTALAWVHGNIVAGGCDRRVVIYNMNGRVIKQFDYSRSIEEADFSVACSSPSSQAVLLGGYNKIKIFIWNSKESNWEEGLSKEIKHFYTVSAVAWKKDGSKVACGSLTGGVFIFETVLKRATVRGKFEIIYVAQNQVVINVIDEKKSLVIASQHGGDIDDIKFMGKDNFVVARTMSTMIIGNVLQNLTSEISWNKSSRKEKFYFDYPPVCLIYNLGELHLVEYGKNNILASVRTEFANPHLLSVRINERKNQNDNKKLAYLLDLKTICVIDLVSNLTLSQINHDTKIDWLELSEIGHKLLFRDRKQRLMLVNVETEEKRCIYSSVGFVQWVEESDVVVAQSGNNIAVWYNIELPDNPSILPVQGEVVDVLRRDGKTQVISMDERNSYTLDLDEALVEFGTAIHENDLGRAVLYLESIERPSEAEAMWYNLLQESYKQNNLLLASRCHAGLNHVTSTVFLQGTIEKGLEYAKNHNSSIEQCPEVWVRLALINGDLNTAENIYLEQGNIEAALNMHKKYHKWDKAIKLAEQKGYENVNVLREEYMQYLMDTDQFTKAGDVLEKQGKFQEAVGLHLKSKCYVKAAKLMQKKKELMENETLLTSVVKTLLKKELFEPAAEIYESQNNLEMAILCYRKGKLWSKALDLARVVNPQEVVELEEEWGDYLMETKQMDAAINHFIEAGKSRKALDAAIAAQQWKKAIHIIQVISDPESVQHYYDLIGQHLQNIKDFAGAEKMFINGGIPKKAIEMYMSANKWETAHSLARKYLSNDEIEHIFLQKAELLQQKEKYREAEELYKILGLPDAAITMYKQAEEFDHVIRLVERYHPDLLSATHTHVAHYLENQHKYRSAEVHYVAAGDFKAAISMYTSNSLWEEAYRVSKISGIPNASEQVAYLWARSLPIDSSIKLLQKLNLLENCIDIACETGQFDFGLQLSKHLPEKAEEVHYKRAMSLEDEGKLSEAETEFVLGGKAREAIFMYIHQKDWTSALRVAEIHEPSSVPDVLKEHALQCFENKQFAEFEMLLIRAQLAQLIVEKYKSVGMWQDAFRVCKEHVPSFYESLEAEYLSSNKSDLGNSEMETLVHKVNEYSLKGQYKLAIETLIEITNHTNDPEIIHRTLLKAAEIINKFLTGEDALEATKIIGLKLLKVKDHMTAAQLYINVDLTKEAIDCFISANDWASARKIARELEPSYEIYVENRFKDNSLNSSFGDPSEIGIIETLDLLAEQGQWIKCVEKAKTQGLPILHKYLALYANDLIKNGDTVQAVKLFNTYGTPAISQNFKIYNRIVKEFLALPIDRQQNNYEIWSELRHMLHKLVENIKTGNERNSQSQSHFEEMLLIVHFYALRSLCKKVSSLKQIGVKISVGLLRYIDTIPADKAFYEAGIDLRAEGRTSEAFIFLNYYLDICEAIEEGDSQIIDSTEMAQTDIPTDFPLPNNLFLQDDQDTHDEIRQWVLTTSMDQNISQNLPLDERGLYESSLKPGENPCLISCYPIKGKGIKFKNHHFQVNGDCWAKINITSQVSPQSDFSNIINFLELWLGDVEDD